MGQVQPIPGSQPAVHEETLSQHMPTRPPTAMDNGEKEYHPHRSPRGKPHKIVPCFDGTGNKFQGDDSDSNILKICRMLDRTATDQCKLSDPSRLSCSLLTCSDH